MEIVTGNTGRVHVTPIDDAVRNSHLMSITKKAVFTVPNYESFRAQAITANEVRIYSGYGSNQGRIFKIDENDFNSVTIENGSLGVKRMDLIVARYTMNQQTGVESIDLAVIKGELGNDYTQPEHNEGNINSRALIDDFVLYKVYINGVVIDHLEACFELLPDGGELGLALQRMAEIEADIERIPFDLGDTVNKTYVDNAVQNLGENLLRSTYFINILDRPFVDFCQATTQIVGETKLSIRGNNNAYTVTLIKGDGTTSTLPVNDMDIDDEFMNKIKNSQGMELTMNDGQIIRTYKGNSKTPILLVDSSNKLGYYTFIFRKISNYDIDLILTAPTAITSGFSASQIFGISKISLIEDNFIQD